MVLVDTSVWSLHLRRKSPVSTRELVEFERLVRASHVALIGLVRQELLTGIKSAEEFELLRSRLDAFRDLPTTSVDHVLAAHFANVCRDKGLQGSLTDFLVCAVSVRENMPIFTSDLDFVRFAQHIPIRLHHS